MPFDDVYLVTDRLRLVAPIELEEFEKRIGFPLPFGYREYLTTLGIGRFCLKMEVQTPSQIESEMEYWRREFVPIAVEEGFWKDGALLTSVEMAESVVFATTSEGDRLVSCPGKGGAVFELPRHESKMCLLPQGFLKPFDCAFGARERFRFPFFEAENGRSCMTQLLLKADAKYRDVWDLVEDRWGSTFRVVEGDTRSSGQTTAFIKSIEGAVPLEEGHETPWFYFQYDADYFYCDRW